MDAETLETWIGKTRTVDDVIDIRQARLLGATLDCENKVQDGGTLPPLWHWIYFAEPVPTRETGRDGHAALGGFMPTISLPRRMWAGGRLTFGAPLRFGATARKTSTIAAIDHKTGRSGPMVFVTVRHIVESEGRVCLTEEHDVVYLEPRQRDAAPPTPPAPPQGAEMNRTISPSAVWLFRYSALTFNGHRIHYDVDFCRDVEGYPDLVVHGPLQATLLAGLAEQVADGNPLASFDFRAVSPVFADKAFSIAAKADAETGTAWVMNPDGALAMRATFAW